MSIENVGANDEDRKSGLASCAKELFEGGGAVVEDAAEVRGDEEAIDDGTAGDSVFDFVADERAAVALVEGVFVMPVAVGAAKLIVGEEVGRIPAGDFTFPTDRDAVNFDSVLNACADGHEDWFGSEHLEFEKCWRKHFEIFGGCEEGEDFFEGMREPEFRVEGEEFHWVKSAL